MRMPTYFNRLACFFAAVLLTFSCKKDMVSNTTATSSAAEGASAISATAKTIGFFLIDWQPKSFVAPQFINSTIPSSADLTITIDAAKVITKIPRSMFGNNANLWMTQLVTEPAFLTHTTNLHPHIIRFPGGSISDVFFWNAQPGVPPADAPSTLVNADGSTSTAGYWFGKNTASWTCSVDSYYSMLQQTGNKGIITINYGYARYGTGTNPVATAAHLAADWVRYDNGRTQYWEIGNENYGDWEAGYRINTANNHDGQPALLSGQLYGQHIKVFIDSMKAAAQQIGKKIHIGAVYAEAPPQSWETDCRKNWNSGLTAQALNRPDFYVVHNYYTPWNTNSNATDILNSATSVTPSMMNYVVQNLQSNGALVKPVALDEWNIFAINSYQQVSHINGMHAVLLLGEAIKHKYGMTARWDMLNSWDNGNDHGIYSDGNEPGIAKWTPRPAFYHMYFFEKLLGDQCIAASGGTSSLSAYASLFTSGEINVALVNKSATAITVKIKPQNFVKGNRFYWYSLAGGTDNGEFSRKVYVNGTGPAGVSGGPDNYTSLKAYAASAANGIRVTVPARGVVIMAVEKAP